ncbi:PRKCA-binding protein isoform X1 [Monodelphis domestica]|uniref:PRKCA-binding protein n=1 Tax=Monodelphis domestica TaxID=13616 RepID=H9H7M2_MONDO|nr:PRKCA-binding protein isoform X1 [Monodelphis domestica]
MPGACWATRIVGGRGLASLTQSFASTFDRSPQQHRIPTFTSTPSIAGGDLNETGNEQSQRWGKWRNEGDGTSDPAWEVTEQPRPRAGRAAGDSKCRRGPNPARARGRPPLPGTGPRGRAAGAVSSSLDEEKQRPESITSDVNWTIGLRGLPVPNLGIMFADMDYDIEEDKLGIPTVPGTVTLQKDSQNLIGISIGGGALYCPCLYIVQVFDNTPAAIDGTVAAGDEITGVNGKSVKGKTKVEVAKMIQVVKGEVTIHYNKLQADPKQGKSLDIVLKKVKHRLVENMSSGTADALGLSRAILCNDGLVKRLEELERTAELYKGMTEHTKSLLRAFFDLSQTHRAFGDVFSVIGVREPQPAASEAFVKFAEAHRNIEKFGIRLLKTIKPMLTDLNTYLNKAIPDTRLTIKKYLDVKFEYLSYCLKVKEMDDEEYSCIALGEPLYRVSTGNYEYRLILRCRQEARTRFAKMRKDVLEKIELLDQKHVQDIVFQLQRFVSTMSKYYDDCYAALRDADVFPIEVDLARTTLAYGQKDLYTEEEEEEEGAAASGEPQGPRGSQEENGEKLIDMPE